MKRHRNIYAPLTGLLLLLAASCAKEAEFAPDPEGESGGTPAGVECVFSGALEIPGSSSVTKVGIIPGEGQQRIPQWEEGDKIKIFYKNGSEMASAEGIANSSGSETTFTATLPEGVETFYAVYPAYLDSSVDENGNFSVKMKKSGEDLSTFADACICIAKSGPEKQFQFRNICAILKFKVESKGSILQICSIGANPVDGTIAASIADDGSVKYADVPYSETEYTRQLKKIAADGTTCYIPILPGVMEKGIAVNHLATYDAPAAFAEVSIPFERSHIYDLGTLDGHIVKDYYFSESGSGDLSGKSAENAGNCETFKRLVGCSDENAETLKCDRYLQIWKTKGITCHFADGKYVFGDAQNERLTIDFWGAVGSVYSEFRIVGSGNTVFSGDGKYGILNVYDRARVHIDNITFADASCANTGVKDNTVARGAALYLKDRYASGENADQKGERKAAPRVWLTKCIFDGNKTTDESVTFGDYVGGSAINIANGAVYADHCIFRNNFDKGVAGCIRLSGNTEKEWLVSYAFFNACLFTGNTVGTYKNSYGCLIQQNRKGALLGMYNCTLYNNNGSAPAGERYGWNIINLERSAIIANTTLVDNMYIDSSTDANADPGYAVRVQSTNGLNHCIFANNLLMNSNSKAAQDKKNRGYTFIGPSGTNTSTSKIFMEGGSLFGLWQSNYANATYVSVTPANEYGTASAAQSYYYSDIDDPAFSDGIFTWKGTLKDGSVKCDFMSSEIMTSKVLSSDNINQSDDFSHVSFSTTSESSKEDNYPGFYGWLKSLNAIDVDAKGQARPSTGWTPGAYQAK